MNLLKTNTCHIYSPLSFETDKNTFLLSQFAKKRNITEDNLKSRCTGCNSETSISMLDKNVLPNPTIRNNQKKSKK